jgi:hypothetical protein
MADSYVFHNNFIVTLLIYFSFIKLIILLIHLFNIFYFT